MGAIVSHINYTDSATITNSIGTVNLALNNMKTKWLRSLARSTSVVNPAVIVFDVDLGSAKDIITLGAIGLNAAADSGTSQALMEISLSNVAAGNDEVASLTTGAWSDEWDLPYGQACWIHAESAPWSARYVRVELTVDRPTGSEWVDIRRLWIGGGVLVPDGMDDGWGLEVIDPSAATFTARGGYFVQSLTPRRRLRGGFSAFSSADMVGDTSNPGFFNALATAGRRQEVVVTPRSNAGGGADAKKARHLQTIYGVFSEWEPLVDRAGSIFGVERFSVDEIPYPALS